MNEMSVKAGGRLGLVAGGGGLPRQVAEACVQAGRPFFVVRLKGFADPVMSQFPGIDVGLGEFGKAFNRVADIRLVADYTGDEVDSETARWSVDQSGRFVAEISRFIQQASST